MISLDKVIHSRDVKILARNVVLPDSVPDEAFTSAGFDLGTLQ